MGKKLDEIINNYLKSESETYVSKAYAKVLNKLNKQAIEKEELYTSVVLNSFDEAKILARMLIDEGLEAVISGVNPCVYVWVNESIIEKSKALLRSK